MCTELIVRIDDNLTNGDMVSVSALFKVSLPLTDIYSRIASSQPLRHSHPS